MGYSHEQPSSLRGPATDRLGLLRQSPAILIAPVSEQVLESPARLRFRPKNDFENGIRKELIGILADCDFVSSIDRLYLTNVCDLMFELHRGQMRDDKRTPYCQHPFDVFKLAVKFGVRDVNALAAFLLHDSAEDFGKQEGVDIRDRWKKGLEFLSNHPLLQGERREVLYIVDRMTMKLRSTADTPEKRAEEDRRSYLNQFRGTGTVIAKAWFGKQLDILANSVNLKELEPAVCERRTKKYSWYMKELGLMRKRISSSYGGNVTLLRATVIGVLDNPPRDSKTGFSAA